MPSLAEKIEAARQRSERAITVCKAAAADGSQQLLASMPGSVPYSQGPTLGEAREQYQHNRGWVYTCVKAIAQRCAAQPCYVARQASSRKPARRKSYLDSLEPLETHPLLDALCDPNELMTRWALLYSTVASLQLTGKAFWWFSESSRQGLEFDLWPIPANWIEPADNLRSAWIIRPNGGLAKFTVPGDRVAYFCLPDPGNPFGATSPLAATAAAVSIDESIQAAQDRAFKNGIFPQVILKAGRLPGMLPGQQGEMPILEPAQRKQLIESIRSLYRGVVRYNEPLILDGLIEGVEKLSQTPAELDFLNSGKATKSRIFEAFGVNPIVTGQVENANKASSWVAEHHFCKTVCNPVLTLLGEVITGWLGAAFQQAGEKLVFYFEPCIAHDEELTLKQWELAAKFGFVSGNEVRTRLLGLESVPELAGYLQPGSMIPLEQPAKQTNGKSPHRLLEALGAG